MSFSVKGEFVAATEEKLQIVFPPSYVSRMIKINGGEVSTPRDSWSLYPILDTGDRKRLKRTFNDVVRETASAREWEGFPTDAIAIGGNGAGDQLVFMRQKGSEKALAQHVYWWNHETGALHLVAEDFDDLEFE